MKSISLALWFASLLLPVGSAHADFWIGCGACQAQGNWVSPACSTCNAPVNAPPLPLWGMPQVPYCATCAMNPINSLYSNPWWSQMAPNYWNFNMPPGYNGLGVSSPYLVEVPFQPPGGGGFYAAKPVVYVRGPKGAKIEITVSTPKGEVLAAVPSLDKWKAEIEGDQLVTSSAKFDYFFYDAWLDHNILQDKSGYCGDRTAALDYMKTSLEQRGFPEAAIQEFKQTWVVKLPYHQELCVYPQTEENLRTGVQLSFKPANVRLIQLQFIVVPKKFFASAEMKYWKSFRTEPKSELAYRALASDKKTPDANEIRVYDWGVGFLRMTH